MYANQIEHILTSDVPASKHFAGVYSCDLLPVIKRRTYSLVVNTHKSGMPGEHWQVIHVKNKYCYFFCSLGRKPNAFMRGYMQQFRRVYHNVTAPQLLTEYTCGGYAIFVIAMLGRGHKFIDICKLFDFINHDDVFIRNYLMEAHKYQLKSLSFV